MKKINNRESNYEVDDIFLKRHSSRAMSGEKLTEEELKTLFEAARWAPSAMNAQPWRFIYASNGNPEFEEFLSFLMDGNKIWCKNAGALIIVISKNNSDKGEINKTHSFDTGSAWENLALQASEMGLVAHGMSGFFYDLIKEKLSIPDEYSVEIMIAVGKVGNIEDLPEQLRAREIPNNRKPLEEIISEGKFSFN